MLVSSAVIRVNLTPLGGLKVYCVTFGPTLISPIAASILNSASVSWIIWAFWRVSPASAPLSFFSNRSKLGASQFGSRVATKACSSLTFSGFSTFFNKLFFSLAVSIIGTPAFNLISPKSVFFSSSAGWAIDAFFITERLLSSSLVLLLIISQSLLKTVNGDVWVINRTVINAKTR